jgi:hypothetical protein
VAADAVDLHGFSVNETASRASQAG